MAASLGPWSDDERGAVRSAMEAVYRTFVGRVAAGRGKSPEEIEKIAQGRVWTGARARELGLVDEIGGLDAALAEARKLAKVDAATDLEIYPPAPTLRDVIHGWGGVQTPFGLAAELRVLDPPLVDAAPQPVQTLLTVRATPVQPLALT